MAKQRDHWGSRMGFVLAAAGSAVGLGNLWKFPYIAWNNEGGAFVLVYLACIALIGAPIMMAEILIGRRTQASPVPALENLAAKLPGGRKWSLVGWLGVVAGLIILAFYTVIAGWSISSFLQCLKWSFSGYTEPQPFGEFLAIGWLQVLLTAAFSLLTAAIVMRGISGGIEKATKILVPTLITIMVLLVLVALNLSGSGKALTFLFTPNFTNFHWQGVLEALGHAFFTLSLGMGAMITYGSYMNKGESIPKASFAIVIVDTLIALMACIIMYSILFSFPDIQSSIGKSSVGMLFVTLPQLFYTKMALGWLVGPVFYILVGFAALTSTISLLEVVVSLLVDKMSIPRRKATVYSASVIFVFSIFCALSLGAVDFFSNFKVFGHATSGFLYELNRIFFADKAGVLTIFDHVSANWFLPLGGFLITLFVGWFLDQRLVLAELGMVDADGKPTLGFKVFQFLLRFVAPLAIAFIIFKVITGTDFS